MTATLRLLVICNSQDDANEVGSGILRAGYNASVQWIKCEKSLRKALSDLDFDLAFFNDQTTNAVDIVTARSLIAESDQDVPFIVISSVLTPEAQQIVSQVKAGVDDFIEWGKPEMLVPAVDRALHTSETRRQNRLAEQEMHYRANFDSLTGLPNRTLMLDRLSQAMKRARREASGVLLMFLDLDHFKAVNDSMGHLAGDLLLRQVAQRITTCLRDSDTAARIGGDEFAIILADADQTQTAQSIADKLLKTLSEPFELDQQRALISASIGITAFPHDGEEADVLLKNADCAMYQAKSMGRNAYKVFDGDSQPTVADFPASHIKPASKFSAVKYGLAFAASLGVLAVASIWLTSLNTEEPLRIAIEEGGETMHGFSTASGSDD